MTGADAPLRLAMSIATKAGSRLMGLLGSTSAEALGGGVWVGADSTPNSRPLEKRGVSSSSSISSRWTTLLV
jgi:hypothetical protein